MISLSHSKTNEEVFDLVDRVATDSQLGAKINSLNYKRYLIKQKLQKRFFGNELEEQKIGY